MEKLLVTFKPIGIVRSPFKDTHNMPIQPIGADGIQGELVIYPDFVEGLKDLEGFSYIYLIFQFHKSDNYHLLVSPFIDNQIHGVFATRSPHRPNSIGLSILKLILIKNEILTVGDLDILDGTPILDIKPYVPDLEQRKDAQIGWLAGHQDKIRTKRSG